MPTVRYLVDDVDAALAFYALLGFADAVQMGPFARVSRDGLTLWLSGPGTSAARPMPNGDQPSPGGWNRLVVEVGDIEVAADRLRAAGVHFRNEIISGPGGRQVLVEDPSGNPIELFQAGG